MKKRNTQKTMAILVMGIIFALLSGCDNGFGSLSGVSSSGSESGDVDLPRAGMGEIRIGLGGPAKSLTMVPTADELGGISFEVDLNGPYGQEPTKYFGPDGGTISLSSGNYTLTVKLLNGETPKKRLRAIANETIKVSSGSVHFIAMKACIGVFDETEFSAALQGTLSPYTPDTTSGAGDLIVLQDNIITFTAITSFTVDRDITIMAEPGITRTLKQAAFTVNPGASLTLGKAGETAYPGLVLDGDNLDYASASSPALNISGGSLTINGNTEITKYKSSSGKGGAIYVHNNGSLTINDGYGKINNNENIDTIDGNGGAIFIEDSVFEMNGGSITNNKTTENGGGVYIGSGSQFTMSAGTIGGSSSDGNNAVDGGGVYIEDGGQFTMNGTATISYNEATGNGGGVYVTGSNSQFTMSGTAAISNNDATGDGGGVYLDGGQFTMSGGIIGSGNTAVMGAGLLIADGTITTSGSGSISGNTATGNGQAVYNDTTTQQTVGGTSIGGNSSHDSDITW
ncbi:hypothetical protein AGMMS49928_10520 [Spirochaetia bacterium]|nr:hypothetical protein AGMMS49928_10520 [Spirochaetia bacterium]